MLTLTEQWISNCVVSQNNELKFAKITQLFKKGNTQNFSNYRPVSVLLSLSKIYEKIMVGQSYVYFESIFSKFLSGFRPRHSCDTVLIRMFEDIKQHLDAGKIVCALPSDLSRAFDRIPLKLFISKLHAHGFSISAYELIFNYYYGRKQRVKIGDNTSEWQYVYKGSIQGSIIGPISCNIFSYDMLMILDSDIQVYNSADDILFMSSGYDYAEAGEKLASNVALKCQII